MKGWSEVQDTPRNLLELGNQLVELGRLLVKLLEPRIAASQIRDEVGVLLQDVADGIERMPSRSVELGGFDQVGGNF